MTEPTTTPTEPPTGPDHPQPDILLTLIVAILAPMFLGVTAGDVDLARIAATQTVNAYRARDQTDLIAIAQIIAYGLAALGSLSLSMADDISISMALRLRGNANALNRSAEQNRRAATQTRPTHAPPQITEAAQPTAEATTIPALAEAQKTQAAPHQQPTSKTTPTDRQTDARWAAAMTDIAAEFTASLPNLPPVERQLASRRVTALSTTASHLIAGEPLPPFRMHHR